MSDCRMNICKAPAASFEPTDEQALAFHRAITDGAIGSDEVEDIKRGLRAVFTAAPRSGQQNTPVDICVMCEFRHHGARRKANRREA